MTHSGIFLLTLALFTGTSFADFSDESRAANLKASDGTEIQVAFHRNEVLNPGDSIRTWADRVVVRAFHPSFSGDEQVRAVLINLCRVIHTGEEFRAVYHCDLRPGRTAVFSGSVPEQCTVEGHYYLTRQHPQLEVGYRHRSGHEERCRQQIAFVVNGRWLVDPITSEHNFNFQF